MENSEREKLAIGLARFLNAFLVIMCVGCGIFMLGIYYVDGEPIPTVAWIVALCFIAYGIYLFWDRPRSRS